MCWFVTVVVASKCVVAFRARVHEHGLESTRQENASIAAALSSLDRMPTAPQLWSVTRGGCSCDLIRASRRDVHVGLRGDLREVIASVAELGQPVAFVAHTYRGKLDESFEVTKGPRRTPEELRANDAIPVDAVCVARDIPRFGGG